MAEKRDIRPGLAIGVSIGIALAVVKTVESGLKQRLGDWPAFGVGVLVAIVVVSITTQLVYRFVKSPQ